MPGAATVREEGGAPPISDALLVVGTLLGSNEAFAELVRRYRGPVLTLVRVLLHDAEVAEDIAQESLLVAYRALGQLRNPGRFGAWLFAIARHRALRYRREKRRPPIRLPSETEPQVLARGASNGDPAQDCARRETSREVREALAVLPMDHRIALELRYWNGLSMAAIAAALSVPVSTVKWRLHAAKKTLIGILDESRRQEA